MRSLSFARAINEALRQTLAADESVYLIGQGVTSPWYVGSTTAGLVDKFGTKRVIDTPVSENGVTGVAIGSALAGMRPVLVFPRMDFMYYAMDQIANNAANWRYMFGGRAHVSLTLWGIVNRGGEQAAQHAQAIQAMFAHIPGLKVVMPSGAYDAKGLLVAAIWDDDPVVYVDDRWLYDEVEEVPEELYAVPIGQGVVRKPGRDVTMVATSYMARLAGKAADALEKEGISAEVIDLRSLKPLDEAVIIKSVTKTGRLVVADGGWSTCGAAAEVAARVAEKAFSALKAPVRRVTLPDAPAPASSALEKVYYPGVESLVQAARGVFRGPAAQ